MAIWQFCFNLLPENVEFFSKDFLINNQSIHMISQVLIPQASWSEDNKVFGNIESTCLEIFYLNGFVDEITVRIDAVNYSNEQIECIVQFAKINNLQMSYQGKTIITSAENISQILISSEAYAFSCDSKGFFERTERTQGTVLCVDKKS